MGVKSDNIFQLRDVRYKRLSPRGETTFEVIAEPLFLERGKVYGVVANSGTGKTTLLNLLAFTLQPTSLGVFCFQTSDGDIYSISDIWSEKRYEALADLRKHYIGVVLQTGGLLPFVSVRRNIDLPRKLLGTPCNGCTEKVARSLGIYSVLEKLPAQLSVGERQRVAVARAIAHRPVLVLADEPTSALDPENASKVMALLFEHVQAIGATLILATHDATLLQSGDEIQQVKSLVELNERGFVRSTFWT